MLHLFLRFVLSVSAISSLSATIIEHNTITAVLDYVTESDYHAGTLVIFDLDNTVIEPLQLIGSDQWFTYHVQQKIQHGYDVTQAIAHILPLYEELQHVIDLNPVEPITPLLIATLQHNGITVIALTLRSIVLAPRTTSELMRHTIDFSRTAFLLEGLEGPAELQYYCTNGIIFCNGNDKGKVLRHILDYHNHTPSKVIIIDDKERHIHAIKRIFPESIPVLGIRYSHLDAKVQAFDPAAAHAELQEYLHAAPLVSL